MLEYESVEIDLSPNATHLYLFFAGFIGAFGRMPPFEFYNSSKILGEHRIFFRDLRQSWYQTGLVGISQDIPATVTYIKQQIAKLNPQKVFFVGNSMGGYAAILFSELIGDGETIVFAPQTFISPCLRFKHKDDRWHNEILATYQKSILKMHVWDIKPMLLRPRKNRKVSVFVSADNSLDFIHAKRLQNLDGVHLYEFTQGGHELVRLLRDQGKLPEIMLGNYVHNPQA